MNQVGSPTSGGIHPRVVSTIYNLSTVYTFHRNVFIDINNRTSDYTYRLYLVAVATSH